MRKQQIPLCCGERQGTEKTGFFFFFQKQSSVLNLWFHVLLFVFYFLIYIHLWLLWVFIAAQAVSGCGKKGLFSVVMRGLLTVVTSLVGEHRFQALGLHWLWCTGFSCSAVCRSSRPRDRTRVPSIGRWILIHCTTREVLDYCFWIKSKHCWKYFMSALLHPHHLLFPFKSGSCGYS